MAEGAGAEWVDAGGGYALAIEGASLRCRNAKGKTLSSVPPAVRDGEVATQLRALRDWLAGHEAECRSTVETWMLRSLPVPVAALAATWEDPRWRAALTDLVVAPLDRRGQADWSRAGLLRDAGAKHVAVVSLDGETVRLAVTQVGVPHPVLFEDLEDWREMAADLGVEQSLPQLLREVFRRGDDVDAAATAIDDFTGAQFDQLRHATARCRTIGSSVSGGYAVCRVWEAGEPCEARYWIGAEAPDSPVWTGDLVWVTPVGKTIPLGRVGPVAWSEGFRMATLIHAARKQEEAESA